MGSEPEVLRLVSYHISYEPLSDPAYGLPRKMQKEANEIYGQILESPRAAIDRLLKLLERRPDAARLLNFLSAAYSMTGMAAEAREVAERNYRLHPNYLFAKLGYAEFFMATRDLAKVKEIMRDTWEVSLHCPGRKTLHISEVLGFQCLAARYLAMTGNLEAAESCADLMKQLAPESPETQAALKRIRFERMMKRMGQFLGLFEEKRKPAEPGKPRR